MKIEDPVTDEELLEMVTKGDLHGMIEKSPEEIARDESLTKENFAKLSDEEKKNLTFGKFLELAYP